MERTSYQASNCSIARTLQALGEKWTLLVIRESFYGSTRFEQFHRVLNRPRNLLSERLTKLVEGASSSGRSTASPATGPRGG
jgi:DNA-binding HxlR family transcriptional regulator